MSAVVAASGPHLSSSFTWYRFRPRPSGTSPGARIYRCGVTTGSAGSDGIPETGVAAPTLASLSARDPRGLGPFRLLGRLGAGGMGRVYLGRDRDGRPAAVKVLHPRFGDDPQLRLRFRREVDLARTVRHPGLAEIIDADPAAPLPWLAMRYVAGPSVAAAVARAGALPAGTVATVGTRLAEACAALHDAGIVHRDITPANVLLTTDGPVLIDFGIARAVTDTAITGSGQLLGAPGFLSPEQALGEDTGPASDVFSLAAVLAFAATARYPFGASGNPIALLRRVVDDPPDLDGVPARIRKQLVPCLAKQATERPSARALAGRLRPHGDDAAWPPPVVGALTPAPVEPDQPAPLYARRPVLAGLGAVATIATASSLLSGLAAAPADVPRRRTWTLYTETEPTAVAAADDDVFVTAGSEMIALDRATGLERWRTYLPDGAVSSLRVLGPEVCAGVRGGLVTVDRAGGPARWWHRRAAAAESTLVLGDLCVSYAAGIVTAERIGTAAVVWERAAPVGEEVEMGAGAGLVVLFGTGGMLAFDGAGELRWSSPLAVTDRSVAGRRLAVAGATVVAAADRWLYALDTSTGRERWDYRVAWTRFGSWEELDTVVADDHAVFAGQRVSGSVVMVDPDTGQGSRWSEEDMRFQWLLGVSGDIVWLAGEDAVHAWLVR